MVLKDDADAIKRLEESEANVNQKLKNIEESFDKLEARESKVNDK